MANTNPYLTFQSDTAFTLSATKYWDGTVEYSTDLNTWTTWDGTSLSSSSSSPYVLYLRGSGNTKMSSSSASSGVFQFSGATNLKAIGNMNTLLEYSNPPTIISSTHCYYYMFYGCSSLTTAPELPATTLAVSCYQYMFQGCTSLTTAPELPATTLAGACYAYMFVSCTSLTTAPELPATTLEWACYQGMFQGCTKLKVLQEKTSELTSAWRIPSSGTISTEPSNWNASMLLGTGGTFTSNPSINTTYYVLYSPKTKKTQLKRYNGTDWDIIHPETEASQVTGLATVATSGSYNDLSNKPTIYDCNIQWGGNPITADVSPIGTCLGSSLSANRLAFMPGQQITIEYSTDGGTTWTDYDYSTDTKSSLFTFDFQYIPIGGNTDATLNHKTRITLTAIESNTETERYTYFMAKKLLINVSTSAALSVEIQTRTGTNYLAGNDTWASAGTYSLAGWPAWNDIPLNNLIVGGYAEHQNWQLRFIFNITAISSMTSSYPLEKFVNGIKMFGPNAWIFPSTLASTNNIFSYDIYKTVTFPSTLIATTFKKTNGTSSQFLKADGSVDSTAYSATSHTHTLSLATSSDTNVVTLNHGTKYKLTAGGSSLVFTMPANPNTWRGIQNNLTSTSTTDSLSAYQGKLLNDGKADKATTFSGYGIEDIYIKSYTSYSTLGYTINLGESAVDIPIKYYEGATYGKCWAIDSPVDNTYSIQIGENGFTVDSGNTDHANVNVLQVTSSTFRYIEAYDVLHTGNVKTVGGQSINGTGDIPIPTTTTTTIYSGSTTLNVSTTASTTASGSVSLTQTPTDGSKLKITCISTNTTYTAYNTFVTELLVVKSGSTTCGYSQAIGIIGTSAWEGFISFRLVNSTLNYATKCWSNSSSAPAGLRTFTLTKVEMIV